MISLNKRWPTSTKLPKLLGKISRWHGNQWNKSSLQLFTEAYWDSQLGGVVSFGFSHLPLELLINHTLLKFKNGIHMCLDIISINYFVYAKILIKKVPQYKWINSICFIFFLNFVLPDIYIKFVKSNEYDWNAPFPNKSFTPIRWCQVVLLSDHRALWKSQEPSRLQQPSLK